MKNAFKLCGIVMALSSPFTQAESLLRLTCDDEDAGAVATLNGREVGTCPADIFIPEGSYQVRVVKTLSGNREQVFETQITLIEGQPKSVSVDLSDPQLTAEAAQLQARDKAMRTLTLAQSGDVEAMTTMSKLYYYGEGVERSPANAKIWGEKAIDQRKKQEFELQLRNAMAGNKDSMLTVAALYDQGEGVEKDPVQAISWRQRSHALEVEEQLNNHQFFSTTKAAAASTDGTITAATGFTTLAPLMILSDVIASPTVTTEREAIKNSAVLRPSAWAKPDSMIAKVAQLSESLVAQK